MSSKQPYIMLAIPNMGTLHVRLVEFLLNIRNRIDVYMPSGMLPLDNARNHCVMEFIKRSNSPNDRLWFIDNDIIPPQNALDILLTHDRPICGLLCFMMKMDDKGQPVTLPVSVRYDEDMEYKIYYGQGLDTVDAVGGGCIMIKREVYELIGTRPYTFRYYPDGTLKLVGDYDFCQKAQMAGYDIHVDFNHTCSHIKAVDLKAVNNLLLEVSTQNG